MLEDTVLTVIDNGAIHIRSNSSTRSSQSDKLWDLGTVRKLCLPASTVAHEDLQFEHVDSDSCMIAILVSRKATVSVNLLVDVLCSFEWQSYEMSDKLKYLHPYPSNRSKPRLRLLPQTRRHEILRDVCQIQPLSALLLHDLASANDRFHVPQDHDTAMSAVRNLNGQDVGGRPLRIDLADSDPFLEGKTTVRGELVDSQETRAQWRERERERERDAHRPRDPQALLADLPHGVSVPLGKTAGDLITEVLAGTSPNQIFEVLAQMKASVFSDLHEV